MQGGQGTRTGDAALRLSASRTLSSGGHHCRHVWGGLASLLSVLPTFKQSETQAGLGSREPRGPPLTWRSGKSGPSWPGKATSVPGRPSPPASRAYRELFHGRRHPHIFPFGPSETEMDDLRFTEVRRLFKYKPEPKLNSDSACPGPRPAMRCPAG